MKNMYLYSCLLGTALLFTACSVTDESLVEMSSNPSYGQIKALNSPTQRVRKSKRQVMKR